VKENRLNNNFYVQCDTVDVTSLATLDLYLQKMNIKANEVHKVAKSAFGKYISSIQSPPSHFCFCRLRIERGI
jgi:hypothetical protein